MAAKKKAKKKPKRRKQTSTTESSSKNIMTKAKSLSEKTTPMSQNDKKSEHSEEDNRAKSKQSDHISNLNVKVYQEINGSLKPGALSELATKRDILIKEYLQYFITKVWSSISDIYNVVILYDEASMVRQDTDRIYDSVKKLKEKKPLLLVLSSTGGDVGAAYLIGNLCREYSDGKFVVVVPRKAKSAATLICCAADEIHMGSLSELGPIDPQIKGMPVLGLRDSMIQLAKLTSKYPKSSEMFATYLAKSLNLIDVGYYERVAVSAIQYAERQLTAHRGNLALKPADIANLLVYTYKDHGFVIDKGEAKDIFGSETIKANTKEYEFGDWLYSLLSFWWRVSAYNGYIFYFIGTYDSDPDFIRRRNIPPLTTPTAAPLDI